MGALDPAELLDQRQYFATRREFTRDAAAARNVLRVSKIQVKNIFGHRKLKTSIRIDVLIH
jgi:hypothetical protein